MMTTITRQDVSSHILRVIPALMRMIAAEIRRVEGIAPAQFGLLAMVKRCPRSLGELAEKQGVSLPTMSNSVSVLAERGWVTRLPSKSDRRVMIVELTPPGEQVLTQVQARMETYMTELLSDLSPEQLKQLLTGVQILEGVFPSLDAASRFTQVEKEDILDESH